MFVCCSVEINSLCLQKNDNGIRSDFKGCEFHKDVLCFVICIIYKHAQSDQKWLTSLLANLCISLCYYKCFPVNKILLWLFLNRPCITDCVHVICVNIVCMSCCFTERRASFCNAVYFLWANSSESKSSVIVNHTHMHIPRCSLDC